MKTIVRLILCVLVHSLSNAQVNTWVGGLSNDWHNGCNWSLSTIPTATHDVTIPNVTTYPIINGNAHCRTLNITSTAVNAVTLNSSGGADLCMSSTNGGACATVLTNNITYVAANNTTSTAAICENQTKALVGSPAGGTWSVVSGGGSIAGTTYTPPNVAANTSVTVRYTIAASGTCGASTSDQTFTVNVLNVASNTTNTAAICETQTKALVGSPAGGTWSIVSGGGSIAGTTYTPPNVASNTNVTIRYTIAGNGACSGSISDQTFTVNADPGTASNTTNTAAICETQTKALVGSPAGGTWSIVSGGGSIAGTTYTPPNVAVNTSVTVRYTIAGNGACSGSVSDRTFTVNADPGTASNTTNTAAICENQTKALVGSPAGGTWSVVSGGGSISGTTYTPPNVGANTSVTVRYTIAGNGSCSGSVSDRTFTVNVLNVASNTTSNAAINDTETKTLVGSPAGGTWSVVSGGGSISGTTYTPADVSSATSVTIRYTIPANGGCAATISDVTFTVNDATIPGSWFDPCNPGTPTGPFSFCSYDYFVCPGPGTGYMWYNNTGATITVTLPGQAGYTYSPTTFGTFTLLPGQSRFISNSGGTPCSAAATFGDATWTSSDGGSGLISITY